MQVVEFLSKYISVCNKPLMIAITGRARAGKTIFVNKLSLELNKLGIPTLIYSGDRHLVNDSKGREQWLRDSFNGNVDNYIKEVNQYSWWDFNLINTNLNKLLNNENVVLKSYYDRNFGEIKHNDLLLKSPSNGIIIYENTILGNNELVNKIDKIFFLNTPDKQCLIDALESDGDRRNPVNIASRFILTTYSENKFFKELVSTYKNKLVIINRNGQFSKLSKLNECSYFPVPVITNLSIDSIPITSNIFRKDLSDSLLYNFEKEFNSLDLGLIQEINDFLVSYNRHSILPLNYQYIENIDKLFGDASGKIFFRLSLKDKTKLILMMINWDIEYSNGYSFLEVQSYISALDIPVPKVYSWDPVGGYIIMEDLGDNRFLEYINNLKLSGLNEKIDEAYFKIIDDIVTIQKDYTIINGELYKFNNFSYSYEYFYWELDFSFKNLFQKHLKRNINQEHEQIIYDGFSRLCKIISSSKQSFILRDLHSKNIMVNNNRFYFIDFQDARIGPFLYDLVSLLYDTYNVISEDRINNYIDYYFTKTGIKKEDYIYILDFIAIQRCLKGIGSFISYENRRNDTTYIRYVGNFFEYAIRLLKKYKEFNNLTNLLLYYYYL